MVTTASAYDAGPIAFRFPRGEGVGIELPETGRVLEIGRGRIMREGSRVALVSIGTRLAACLSAAEELTQRGISCTVADARFVKPLDERLVLRLAREHEILITVEEGSIGGFGAAVLHLLAASGSLDHGLKVRTLTLPDRFQDHDTPAAMVAQAGLDAAGILAAVHRVLADTRQDVRRRA
jgi:1-deoxy-D-xylulose-5-phosphate synthase